MVYSKWWDLEEKEERPPQAACTMLVFILEKLQYFLPLSARFIFVHKLHPLCQTPFIMADNQIRHDTQGGILNFILKKLHVSIFRRKSPPSLVHICLKLVSSLKVIAHDRPGTHTSRVTAQASFFQVSQWKTCFSATLKVQGNYNLFHTEKDVFFWASQVFWDTNDEKFSSTGLFFCSDEDSNGLVHEK